MVEKTGMTAMIRKWVGLTAGLCIQALAGSGSCFPFYSSVLKSTARLSQVQLNTIGVAKDFGDNVGLLSGFVCNFLPPWALLLIGAAEGFVGYGMMFLVLTKQIAGLHYWQIALLLCLASNSSTWFNTAVLMTSMRNFPKSRGSVVGLIKGFIGLSGAIFGQIFVCVLFSDPLKLTLLLVFAPLSVIVLAMYFIQPVSSPTGDYDPEEDGAFNFVQIVCVLFSIFLIASSITENFVSITPLVGRILVGVLCVFLFSPLAVPAKFLVDKYFRGGRKVFRESDDIAETREQLLAKSREKEDEERVEAPERAKCLRESAKLDKSTSFCIYPSPEIDGEEDSQLMLAMGEGALRRKRKGPRRGEDFTLSEALVKADFWLLFFTFFCAVGTGNTLVNNLGQIGESQGYSDVTVFLSLFSIFNFIGRLGGGSLSEYYVRSSAMPRTVVMLVAQVLIISGHLLLAAAIPYSLVVGSVLVGFSFGVHYTTMVPTASELFGLRDFGMIYNFIVMGCPVSSLLFSGVIAGYFYDKEAETTTEGVATCTGAKCFQVTFLLMAGVCLLGLLANVLLTLRIAPVYRSLYGATTTIHQSNSYQILPSEDQTITPNSSRRKSSSSK